MKQFDIIYKTNGEYFKVTVKRHSFYHAVMTAKKIVRNANALLIKICYETKGKLGIRKSEQYFNY